MMFMLESLSGLGNFQFRIRLFLSRFNLSTFNNPVVLSLFWRFLQYLKTVQTFQKGLKTSRKDYRGPWLALKIFEETLDTVVQLDINLKHWKTDIFGTEKVWTKHRMIQRNSDHPLCPFSNLKYFVQFNWMTHPLVHFKIFKTLAYLGWW